MKHIKPFKLYEELDKSTYLSAANQLKYKGHKERATRLQDHANSLKGPDELVFIVNKRNENDPLTFKDIEQTASVKNIKILKKSIYTKNFVKPERTYMDRLTGKNKEVKQEKETIGHFYELEVTFDNGITTIHGLGKGFKSGFDDNSNKGRIYSDSREWLYNKITFKDRKDAVKYVKKCNDYIKSQTLEYLDKPILLNVNDFYQK